MLFLIRIVQSICSSCDILALYGSPSYVPVKMQDVFQISLFRPVRALILETRKQGSHWTKQQDIRNFLPFDRRGGVCSWGQRCPFTSLEILYGTIENDTAVNVYAARIILLVLPPCTQCIEGELCS